MTGKESNLRAAIQTAIESIGLIIDGKDIVIEKKSEPYTSLTALDGKVAITISSIGEVAMLPAGDGQAKVKTITLPVFVATKSDGEEDLDVGDLIESILEHEWETLTYSSGAETVDFRFLGIKKESTDHFDGISLTVIVFTFETCGSIKIEYSVTSPTYVELKRVVEYKLPDISRKQVVSLKTVDVFPPSIPGYYDGEVTLEITVLSPSNADEIAGYIENKTPIQFRITRGSLQYSFTGYFINMSASGSAETTFTVCLKTKAEVSNG